MNGLYRKVGIPAPDLTAHLIKLIMKDRSNDGHNRLITRHTHTHTRQNEHVEDI